MRRKAVKVQCNSWERKKTWKTKWKCTATLKFFQYSRQKNVSKKHVFRQQIQTTESNIIGYVQGIHRPENNDSMHVKVLKYQSIHSYILFFQTINVLPNT